MTDWLDETLDRDFGEQVPEGFAACVIARVREESDACRDLGTQQEVGVAHGVDAPPSRGRLLRFPNLLGIAVGAALLLAAGFWMGSGAKPVAPTLVDPGSSEMATLELAELYSNRDLLQDLDILSDADLELAFQDEVANTWILGETAHALEVANHPGEEQ